MGMTSSADGPADETNLTGVGEIRLIPDMSTKCRIPWNPNHPTSSTARSLDKSQVHKRIDKTHVQLHAEAGRGQFELALGHTTCNYAADNLVFTHEVIRAVARKHGLLATFSPKYALDDIGSGSHVHLSLIRMEKMFLWQPVNLAVWHVHCWAGVHGRGSTSSFCNFGIYSASSK